MSTDPRTILLDLIAKQAMLGMPWRETSYKAMELSKITELDVEKHMHYRAAQGEKLYHAGQIQHIANNQKQAETFQKLRHSRKAPCICVSCRLKISEIEKYMLCSAPHDPDAGKEILPIEMAITDFEFIVNHVLLNYPWKIRFAISMKDREIIPDDVQTEVEERLRAAGKDPSNPEEAPKYLYVLSEGEKNLAGVAHSEDAPCACLACRTESLDLIYEVKKTLE